MPLPVVAMAIMAAMGTAKGIAAKSAHNKYANTLAGLKKTVPQSVLDAEQIYKTISGMGLPGYARMQGEIEATLPSAMTQAKDVSDSPAALLGLTSQINNTVTDKLMDLGVRDAMQRVQNQQNLASFESGVKAPIEEGIQNFNNDVQLGVAKEKMLGTSELMGGISSGIASGISAYGNLSYLDYMKGESGKTDWKQFLEKQKPEPVKNTSDWTVPGDNNYSFVPAQNNYDQTANAFTPNPQAKSLLDQYIMQQYAINAFKS